jgi:hypothetical protein
MPSGNAARKYLTQVCSLSEETIKAYHLGLVSYHAKGPEQPILTALCVPVPDERGPEFAPCLAADCHSAKRRGQYVLLTIPELTVNPKDAQWKRGPVLTMYLTPATQDLVVCSSVLDGIALAQELGRACPGRFTITTSTHLHERPIEWDDPEFWTKWQRIYLAHGADPQAHDGAFEAQQEVICSQLAILARRPVLRVRLPEQVDGKVCLSWLDFFRGGGTAEVARELFDRAQVLTRKLSLTENLSSIAPPRLGEFAEGEFADKTYDVAYNYVVTHYYYPFSVLHYSYGANQQKQITRETRLLRNDGLILGWTRVPTSHGSSDVLSTDDGVLLTRPPAVSENATWSLDHILAYARASRTGLPKARPLANVLRDMLNLLEECIWLPHREQFYLLLFVIPVTYVQELFSAVPYVLIQGPKGSGKSELAHVLSWLSSNSTIIGSGSHAFTAAEVDQARGLIVLDDRETLAAQDLDANLLELLKIGYKRATATRGVISLNRKIVRQHVFGVKVITCVSGVEEVVGTRMLHIRTAPYGKGIAKRPIRRFQAPDQEAAHALRQELHGWAFSNVSRIKEEYERLALPGSRWNEILAPVRTFASLCNDAELQQALDNAIESQASQETADVTVDDLLRQTMETLVRRGFTREISVTHVRNELALRLSNARADVLENAEPSLIYESWITRTLKAQGWLKSGAAVRRTRARKKALQRLWMLSPARVAQVLEQLPERPADLDPLAFCQGCNGCEYRSNCPIARHFTE